MSPKKRSRASSSKNASQYKRAGHARELEFAGAIGVEDAYKNNPQAKKDVVDKSGDTHSVKGGDKKLQIFLYGLNRFKEDSGFLSLNGVGKILVKCIETFPEQYGDYDKDKAQYKYKLESVMIELKDKLQNKDLLKAFLNKSFFNSGEVNYLTVKHNGKFHVFQATEVTDILTHSLDVANSIKRQSNQYNNQKVVLKYDGVNVCEIEMRNDSVTHYRKIRFNADKNRLLSLLHSKIGTSKDSNSQVRVYGKAIKKFKV